MFLERFMDRRGLQIFIESVFELVKSINFARLGRLTLALTECLQADFTELQQRETSLVMLVSLFISIEDSYQVYSKTQ